MTAFMIDLSPLRRYWRTVTPLIGVIALMTGLVAYSPTLYRWFCAATGLAGTTQRALSAPSAQGADSGEITVFFDSNVDPRLDWDFRPDQPSVKVKIGVPTEVAFTAHNRSNETVVGQAVYNVTPFQVAPFFYKIQCFCFTSEKLAPGETADMPVVFYIDKDYSKDPDASRYKELTLSYTFYREKDLTPAAAAQTRDLAKGSKDEAAVIGQNKETGFANDAPRE
jgi:cytochrome c oxidase assembly protein subunit 11